MKLVVFFAFFALFAFSSCAAEPDPCNKQFCNATLICTQGECCSGVCLFGDDIPEVEGGAACDDCHACKAPYKCLNDVCKLNTEGCSCTVPEDCGSGTLFTANGLIHACQNNKCVGYKFNGIPCTKDSECISQSCINSICQGTGSEGAFCNETAFYPFNVWWSSQCRYELYCDIVAGKCAKPGRAIGQNCTQQPDCDNKLYPTSVCSYLPSLGRNVCVAKNSVAAGGVCEINAQCQTLHECENSICVNKANTVCEFGSDCGIDGECEACTGNSLICADPDASSETPPSQCQDAFDKYEAKWKSLTWSNIFANIYGGLKELAEFACCVRCTENFENLPGVDAGTIGITDLDFLNLDCAERTFTYVENNPNCCDVRNADNEDCAAKHTGCAEYLLTGGVFGLSKAATIGIAVGASVAFILVVIAIIAICVACCKKRRK